MSNRLNHSKWYDKTWLVFILCAFLFPIGIYALWKNTTLTKNGKIVATSIIAIIVISQLANKINYSTADNSSNAFNVDSVNTQEDNLTNIEEDIINPEIPASKYFKIDGITKMRYIEDGIFEMELEILNNTNYKFTKFVLYIQILYTMKNGDNICESTAQYNEIKPRLVENWKPHSKMKFYFRTPSSGSRGGCYDAEYNRTPEKIVLTLKPFPAISVDLEVNEPFGMYDLLPLWKERQVKEGLR